jgi:hypothetical protein
MKTVKVVYNACFGGFSLSKKAAERLLQLGVSEMEEELKYHEESAFRSLGEHYSTDLPRHDARLVQVVEELGKDANGAFANLQIAHLSGSRYRIDDYDGNESVEEPSSIDWIDTGRGSSYRD